MNRLVIAVALALTSCAPLAVGTPPAPLAQTAVDDMAVAFGWLGYDAALTAADLAVASGRLKGQSAANVKAGLMKVSAALRAASAARRAGNAADYGLALAEARRALAAAQSLIPKG